MKISHSSRFTAYVAINVVCRRTVALNRHRRTWRRLVLMSAGRVRECRARALTVVALLLLLLGRCLLLEHFLLLLQSTVKKHSDEHRCDHANEHDDDDRDYGARTRRARLVAATIRRATAATTTTSACRKRRRWWRRRCEHKRRRAVGLRDDGQRAGFCLAPQHFELDFEDDFVVQQQRHKSVHLSVGLRKRACNIKTSRHADRHREIGAPAPRTTNTTPAVVFAVARRHKMP